MWTIFKKELNSFFGSLVGYLVISIFLVGVWLFVWLFPDTSILSYGYASMDGFFNTVPFVFLFLVPAICMRAFAEEKRNGTLEWLLTKPLSDLQIILAKYLAAWTLTGIALLPTLVYYYSVYELGSPKGNIDTAAVIGSYLGLFLLGGVFAAIGVFASSLTDSQIVAFILAVFFCFFAYFGLGAVASLDLWSDSAVILAQLGLDYHYSALGRGLIDSRNVLYLLSAALVFNYLTWLVLRSRKW